MEIYPLLLCKQRFRQAKQILRVFVATSKNHLSKWKCQVRFRFAINAQTTAELRHVQQSFGCDDSNKRIEVQTHKRYFHPKNMLFTLKSMKWNKCEIYVCSFIYWLVFRCVSVCFLMCRRRRSRNSNYYFCVEKLFEWWQQQKKVCWSQSFELKKRCCW